MPKQLSVVRSQVIPILTGPPMLAFLPALTLGAFWLGGEPALIVIALGLPLLLAVLGAGRSMPGTADSARDRVTGLMLRDDFETAVERIHAATEVSGMKSACFLLELDDFTELADRHGQDAADTIARRSGERLASILREGDVVARLGDSRFGVCLGEVRQLDLELCIQLAGRMQSAVEDPIVLDGLNLYVSCSVGFCLRSRAMGRSSAQWIESAAAALAEADLNGPSAIRAFSPHLEQRINASTGLRTEAAAALENGHIKPWYQPQISTDTGLVTGFEALARWEHPDKGVLGPDVFLPALREAGLMTRLGQVMLYHTLTSLKAWDAAGAQVPRIAVNFATEELRDPGLVERIRWDLDRFGLTPDRLAIEVLETVVADRPDDTVVHNISGLSAMGCAIDLDDFGTGQASISAIRRFSVSRIKIDRSFVIKADRDPEQQQMISAILTLAERLNLDTLAEGVETVGEHALLAQLGCQHVQGFGIGCPMPFEKTLDWIAAHKAKLQEAPRIGRKSG